MRVSLRVPVPHPRQVVAFCTPHRAILRPAQASEFPLARIIRPSSIGGIKIGLFFFLAMITVPLGFKFVLKLFDSPLNPLRFDDFLALDSQGKVLHPIQVSGNEIFGQMLDAHGQAVDFHTLRVAPDLLHFLNENHIAWEPVFSGSWTNLFFPLSIICAHIFAPLFLLNLLKNHRLRLTLQFWSAFEELARQRTQVAEADKVPMGRVLDLLAENPQTANAFQRHKYLFESLRAVATSNQKSMRAKSLLSGIPTLSFLDQVESAMNELFFPSALSDVYASQTKDFQHFNAPDILNRSLEYFWKNILLKQQVFLARRSNGSLVFVNIAGMVKWTEEHQAKGVVEVADLRVSHVIETYQNPQNVIFWSMEKTVVDFDAFLQSYPKIQRPLFIVFTHDGSANGNPMGWVVL